MKAKLFFILALSFSVLLSCCARRAYHTVTPQEQLVLNFYNWYCKELTLDHDPILDDAILKYVDKRTIDILRMQRKTEEVIDHDYFIQGNDFWLELCDGLTAHDLVIVDEKMSTVFVTFRVSKDKNYTIIVVVEKKDDAFYIKKVTDVWNP